MCIPAVCLSMYYSTLLLAQTLGGEHSIKQVSEDKLYSLLYIVIEKQIRRKGRNLNGKVALASV